MFIAESRRGYPSCLITYLHFLGILLTTLTIIMASSPSVISESLRSSLKNGGTTPTVIVKMDTAAETQAFYDKLEAQEFPNRDDRATAVTTGLQELADKSQKELRAFLDSQSPPIQYSSMWISNTLVVKDVGLDILEKMEKIGGIKEIREEVTVHILGGGANANMGVQ